MPRFSEQSFSKLSTCDIELQTLFFEVVKTIDCTVLVGHRSQDAQDKAFSDGNSKLKWPNSKHNSSPSQAVDISPFPVDWKNQKRFYWFAGFVMATAEQLKQQGKMTRSIRYGGDWDRDFKIEDEKFLDLIHFELV